MASPLSVYYDTKSDPLEPIFSHSLQIDSIVGFRCENATLKFSLNLRQVAKDEVAPGRGRGYKG